MDPPGSAVTGRRLARSALPAGLLFLGALATPWIGLREPNAQPDGLVLRALPPLSRVETVRLASGRLLHVHEVRRLEEGAVDYRRGVTWTRIAASELATPWHGHTRYWLGTDGLGRDLASRLLHGARISLTIGAVAAALAVGGGALIGLLAGLSGGWLDGLLMRLVDLLLSVPRLFLALFIVALHGASLQTTILVVAATTWMAAARLVRGEVLSIREQEYIVAARAAGVAPIALACRHVLPLAAAPLVVEGVLRVGDTILLEAALSFLGLGVPPPTPSWGNLIADGRDRLVDGWWIAAAPGVAVVVTVAALQRLGEAARRHLSARPAAML
jgi:peptide/nickel transport system permease protein